ncbi:hypothetical protein LTR66_017626, partial [Elasticomyces elasticus]
LRIMVQERIYRHIKIKGTQDGLRTSREWFEHPLHAHLAAYVRHIEYWIPVWSDKPSTRSVVPVLPQDRHEVGGDFLSVLHAGAGNIQNQANDFPNLTFPLSQGTATLESIFSHIATCFENASILTLEGGHCKNSNVIRHCAPNLFSQHLKQKQLRILPNVRVLSIKGAWNIMRTYSQWRNIEDALPRLGEAHIGYAKPMPQAYATINEFLLRIPQGLRHVDVSLDSMFSKDDNILGSTAISTSTTTVAGSSRAPSPQQIATGHICEYLGSIAPRLESLSFTGKICSCFFTSAVAALSAPGNKLDPCTLQSINLTVKSCCRQRVTRVDLTKNTIVTEEIGGFMADSAGISNLAFIANFERLVSSAIEALRHFPNLKRIKIPYIDLDSPCQQLNPYWTLDGNKVTGIWSANLIEQLNECRPSSSYLQLDEGIVSAAEQKQKERDRDRESDVFSWTGNSSIQNVVNGADGSGNAGANALYPRTIPMGIHTESYRRLHEVRAQ